MQVLCQIFIIKLLQNKKENAKKIISPGICLYLQRKSAQAVILQIKDW